MIIEVFKCPQCGGTLQDVTETGFYACPYCGSKMKITLFAPDPNLRPDGRTTIYDRNSGNELCCVKLARGWKSSGVTISEMQSANWPFTLYVEAISPDQSARIDYRSGASFKEVIASSTGRHIEGGYDQAEMMPMRKLQNAAQYSDSFVAAAMASGSQYSLIETRDHSKIPPENYEAKQNELYQSTAGRLRAMTPPGMRSSVDQAFYQGSTRIYDLIENGHHYRQAVTTIVNGVQISFSGSMMFFGGTNRSLFWDVPYVLTLKCVPEVFEQNYENLIMFCSSMQASPTLANLMVQERSRILGSLEQRQQADFQAHQRMMQEQQASFDAYNQAWHANSARTHNSFRNSGTAGQSASDRMSDMVSEGIRGVNTYIRPDGTEVEYSVVNETAFANVNDSRDTFATQSKAFESADWVEMKKKY